MPDTGTGDEENTVITGIGHAAFGVRDIEQ